MIRLRRIYLTLLLGLLHLSSCSVSKDADQALLVDINMPDQFDISFYAKGVEGARSLERGEEGTIFVGSRNPGKVYALVDQKEDHKADTVHIIDKGLNSPNGVAFRNGDLYVAEISRILRYENIEQNLANPPDPEVVYDVLPDNSHHGWKYIAFGPDDKLYVPVGAPCNVCLKEDARFSSILRMNPDGSNQEIYAKGIRNTVGFDWHPDTKELWFTDNGRDWMGDNKPPDELNKAPEKGMHFGFPFCHGGDIPDPKYGNRRDCEEFVPPVKKLGPHVAALGMTFYSGDMFPPEYKNQIFIAEHGSWNRSTKIGYRITLVMTRGKRTSYETFASGWEEDGKVRGRPVDVINMPDGSLLVSDDYGNAIYRITYEDENS